jgi:hypothetical protein
LEAESGGLEGSACGSENASHNVFLRKKCYFFLQAAEPKNATKGGRFSQQGGQHGC